MAVETSEFCLVVEDRDGSAAVLEFRPHDDMAGQQYRGVWQKLAQAVQKHHALAGNPAPEWTTWKPAEWSEQQRGYEQRQKIVAWHGSNLVGFLNVWPDFASIHQPGKRVLYVEHMAAAPGNLSTQLWVRRYRRVGGALFAHAVLMSHQQGFGGRLGLHAADASALGFYRWLDENGCGGGLFYPQQTGVAGPTPRGAHEATKTYLETKEAGATGWLEEYRRA